MLIAVGILVSTLPVFAQTPDQTTIQPRPFEVASVKPVLVPVGAHAASLDISPGRVTINAAALRQIIGLTYGIQRIRVLGGPTWIDTDLWDIVAKPENPTAGRDDVRLMLQALLADRFKLVVHREMKEVTQYVLAVGKNGSKLQAANDDEKERVVPGPLSGENREVDFYKMSVNGLVNLLANQLGGPVVDDTGLKGFYDFKLTWSAAPSDLGVSLVEAVREQLGLYLHAGKGSAEVLVIDHAEKSTAN